MIKNGNTRIIQDLKDDIFKIKSLQDCTFHDDGIDKCRGIRDKAKAIIDLLNDPARLDEEREFSLK
jgi:epsin